MSIVIEVENFVPRYGFNSFWLDGDSQVAEVERRFLIEA